MSVENVKKFYEAVCQGETLKQKFMELSRKYQGEALDADKVAMVLEQEVLPLAAQMSYSFTMGDLKTYEMEMQQANANCELSDEDLLAVAGGIPSFNSSDLSQFIKDLVNAIHNAELSIIQNMK